MTESGVISTTGRCAACILASQLVHLQDPNPHIALAHKALSTWQCLNTVAKDSRRADSRLYLALSSLQTKAAEHLISSMIPTKHMQSPQVAGTGVLHTDGAPVDDGLDIAAVDEILSQHSSHTPIVKSSTDVQQSAPTSVHQPHRASGATTTPASIANNIPAMAIDLTDEQPQKPAAKPQGTPVSNSYTSNQVNTSGATVDRHYTGQLASTSDRYRCSPVLGLGDCAEQCVMPAPAWHAFCQNCW